MARNHHELSCGHASSKEASQDTRIRGVFYGPRGCRVATLSPADERQLWSRLQGTGKHTACMHHVSCTLSCKDLYFGYSDIKFYQTGVNNLTNSIKKKNFISTLRTLGTFFKGFKKMGWCQIIPLSNISHLLVASESHFLCLITNSHYSFTPKLI